MGEFLLLTAIDCHLCGHGREVLQHLEAEGLVRWQEVDSDLPEGEELARHAPPLRPVLFSGGEIVAAGRLSEKRLRRGLERAGAVRG